MRIFEIQARLRQKAVSLNDPELNTLADELGRRKPEKRAPIASQKMTPVLASLIRIRAETFPDHSHADIGRHFNVNPGRVSEALRGKRT